MDIGGQAVIEGVMMRNRKHFAVAVRLPSGKIRVKKENSRHFPAIFEWYFIRGVVGLGYALIDGLNALLWSSNQQLAKEEKISSSEISVTLLFSFVAAIVLFVIVPFFSARYLAGDGFLFNALDGLFRFVIVIGYMVAISFMDDVKRLFQYHGAEHKAIYCYENKQMLTVNNVRQFSRFHPRCGTSFIFLVLIVSIILFSFIPGVWWVKLVGRIAAMPLIAGIAYELIKLSSTFQSNILVKMLIQPGLWLQRITTKEPTDDQLEVGIAALKAVLPKESF
ncbi:TPA: DUF1385 domain-containing protein [Candidatus Woesearchaeota archaeon]|nr:DUF1385 domain-containing protein [Candidatus Woesearchaeota archaeon]